jgi:hypothetical protein
MGEESNKNITHYFLLEKSSKMVTGLTEVAGEAGESSVDAGRWLNETLKGHKIGHNAISRGTMLSGNFQ